MSRDRLDLERKLLGMASPRALALVEVAALRSAGCNEVALGHLYGVLDLEPGMQALPVGEVHSRLQPLRPLLGPMGYGYRVCVQRRGLRQQLLDQLARSPRLNAWRVRSAEIAASLQPADYLVRSDGRETALRAWLLAGLSPAEIAALLGEPDGAIDYASATRDILPDPPTLSALGRLHGDVAIRILAPYLAARAQHPMDDIGDLLQAGLAAIERGAIDDASLRAFAQLAAMCGRDDLLARIPPGATLARGDIELLQLAFGSSDPTPIAAIAERLAARGSKLDPSPAPLLAGGLQRLALLAAGGGAQRQLLLRLHRRLTKQHANLQADEWVAAAAESLEAGSDVQAPLLPAQSTRADAALPPMSALAWLLLQRWFSLRGPAHAEAAIERALERMRAAGLQRMAHWVEQARAASAERGPAAWRSPEAPWQQLLGVLSELASLEGKTSRTGGERKHSRIRVVLQEVLESGCVLRIEFFEQKPSARGGWTGGRRILSAHEAKEALGRLAPDNDADRKLLHALSGPGARFYGTRLSADSPALLALAECPEVYQEDGIQPLRVRIEKPALTVAKQADGRVELTLSPQPEPDCDALALLDGDCLRVVRFRPEHRRIAKLAAQGGNLLPEGTLPQVLALAPALSQSLAIEAAVDSAELVEDVDARVHVLLEPLREGLRLRLRARPLGEEGMLVVPGVGQRELIGLRGGQPVRALRDLDGERRALKALVDAVPLLAGSENGEPLDLPQPEESLEALSQLTELGESVPLIWPAGQRWAMSKTRAAQQLSLKVRAQRDWFHAEGGLALDDGQVVSLAQLLQALPSAQGRFLRLGGDRIIALTQDLTRKLHGLRALSDERGKIELAPVAAAALEPWLESGAEIEIDRKFREQLAKMERAAALLPALPAGFAAELRDYQLDGYRWMMRLAEWGGGACLADDMGLGKTVQALAVLAARAHLGPALVVAPTSVVANWRAEARRFAPALELRVYGDGDRAEALSTLVPGHLVLASYGLVTQNIAAFAAVEFATLVLDEAQAVKNAAAQRSQAMRKLKAQARIATTGTPIENHLGELWSLMRILNPGLLGSQEHFGKRFIAPLERDPRAPERDTLRRLISPFLLRRLKSQVLEELPPRTEIVLSVEPSAEEAALLAALRRQAIERLAQGGSGEQRRFHVLAELTRLRRAACHPHLVAPEFKLNGAKLDQLLELMQELKENRHRVLVFSQFTDYLALVRAAFDQAGIGYQYLDGSTPAKAREQAVSDFQAGAGDAFLLSLKAGGVGLNLTAADYVIHLDPWWNPAVEQQATDRAHRIGQTRPVTVYKLIVKGSIEEQILQLHGSKRELVDSVLGEQDVAQGLSVEELVGLLAG